MRFRWTLSVFAIFSWLTAAAEIYPIKLILLVVLLLPVGLPSVIARITTGHLLASPDGVLKRRNFAV